MLVRRNVPRGAREAEADHGEDACSNNSRPQDEATLCRIGLRRHFFVRDRSDCTRPHRKSLSSSGRNPGTRDQARHCDLAFSKI
jgi:hypothetical protein